MSLEELLSYEAVDSWEQRPPGVSHRDCAGVAVDEDDNVYLLTRKEPRLLVYSSAGAFLRTWGEGLLSDRPHGLTIGPDGFVYCVDEGNHCVYKFTREGELVLTFGNRGIASETGYDGRLAAIRGGPPFNRPTNIAVTTSGDAYITDGYGNCKVHRFSARGELVDSWGEPGTGAGEFNVPHGVALGADDTVFVADRENDRIQVFDRDGRFVSEWTDVRRPTNLAVDQDGRVFVSELWYREGESSLRPGAGESGEAGRISVFGSKGELLARLGAPDHVSRDSLSAPHDVALDSHGDLYVAQVTDTFAVSAGYVVAGSSDLVKLSRQR